MSEQPLPTIKRFPDQGPRPMRAPSSSPGAPTPTAPPQRLPQPPSTRRSAAAVGQIVVTRLSPNERRLGVLGVDPAPGDQRQLPGDSYRPLTRHEKARAVGVAGGRERSAVGVEPDDSIKMKRLADRLVDGARKLRDRLK